MRRAAAVVVVAVLGLACQTAPSDPDASVLRIEDEMCGRSMVGTAVSVGDGRILTNAHNVVGGDGTLTAYAGDGQTRQAVVVAIDTQRDLALLVASDLDAPALATADAREGARGQIVRLDGDLVPTSVAYTETDLIIAQGHDIYDDESDLPRAAVRAQANVGPGWSGAPMLDDRGRMVGLVFAESRTTGFTYAMAAEELVAFVAAAGDQPLSDTGACTR